MAKQLTSKRAKHQKIAEHLFEQILSGEFAAGEKIPNEHELAKIFHTSRPTVSKALEDLENKGLIDRKPGSGTFVRQTVKARNQKLGLLIPRLTLEPKEFEHFVSLFSKVVSHISQSVHDQDYILLMNDLPSGHEDKLIAQAREIAQQLIGLMVKGVFFLPLELSPEKMEVNAEIADSLATAGISVTLLNSDIYNCRRRSPYDVVGINNEHAAYVLTDYLLSKGVKRIDFVGSALHISASRDRVRGYQNALLDHGITPESRCIHELDFKPFDKDNEQADRQIVEKLMHDTDTEALVCLNDRTAAVIMHHLAEMGVSVPDDIRIVGFDDEPFGAYLPTPLTTIRQSPKALGVEAVRAMTSRILDPEMPARDIYTGTELIVRGSCGTQTQHKTA